MEELFIEDLGKVTGGQCQPDLTTQALGEEGGAPPVDPGRGRGPDLTTFALGEESGMSTFGF